MTLSGDNLLSLRALIARRHDGQLTSEEGAWLKQILAENREARRVYAGYIALYALLELEVAAFPSQDAMPHSPAESSFTDMLSPQRVERIQHVLPPVLDSGFLDRASHLTFGYFSSGWPLAYLVATVIFGIGLLIGGWVHVSQPVQIAEQTQPVANVKSVSEPKTEFVGRITGMVDCKWAGAASDSPGVSLGRKFVLASGLMEITYDTGAKVLLQGPVTYTVESKNGGFVSLGKLTGKVENPKAKGFAVRTPTAVITDLGTEFGVEVAKDGSMNTCVFQGTVMFEVCGTEAATQGTMLTTNDSASTSPRGDVSIRRSESGVADKHSSFVRTLPRATANTLIAYWPMDEGSGRAIYDRSSNHINCWFVGDPAWTAKGRFGGAVRLRGNDEYLRAIKDPKLDIGTDDFTVSLWFKGSRTGDWRRLFSYNDNDRSYPSLLIIPWGEWLRVHLGDATKFIDVDPAYSQRKQLRSTEWQHVAVTRSGGTVSNYVGGARTYSAEMPVVNLRLEDNGNLLLGKCEMVPETFNGELDDVAIWRQALTAAQIKALADGTAMPLNVLKKPLSTVGASAKSPSSAGRSIGP